MLRFSDAKIYTVLLENIMCIIGNDCFETLTEMRTVDKIYNREIIRFTDKIR